MPRRAEDREAAVKIARLIGGHVRKTRTALGLTQENLSERVGISSEALGRIERGAALPSFPTFVSLYRALSVTPDALLREGGEKRPAQAQGSREAQQIAHYAARLRPSSARALLGVARELAGLSRSRHQGR
jgi:transcriptional regulator with XRE-family HTH domain